MIYHSLKLRYIEKPYTFLRTKPKVKVVNWGGVGVEVDKVETGALYFLVISSILFTVLKTLWMF
jgi:hypothetical protein